MKLEFSTWRVCKALGLNVGVVIRTQFCSAVVKTLNVKWYTFVCAYSIMENLVSKLFSQIFASKFKEVAT